MESKFVCTAEFLSYEEGVLLFNLLEENGIPALVKSCGPPSVPFGEGQFFQLLVPEQEIEQARVLSDNFKRQLAEAREIIRCPRCRSEAVFQAETLPFWQKIYYAGTLVFKCHNCGRKFSR